MDEAAAQAPSRLRFSVAPEAFRMLRARDRIRDYLTLHCADPEMIDDVVLAIQEACTNAIRHSGSAADIDVRLRIDGDDLRAAIRDRGVGFDVEAFDPEHEPDAMAPGGRGLYMISRLVDKMDLRCHGGLEVRMVRRAVARCRPAALETGLGDSRTADPSAYSAGRTRTMLEELDEAFAALDWEYRYVHANAAMLALSGKPLDELLGRTPWELWPAFAGTQEEHAYREAMELGRPSTVEQRSVTTGDWHEMRIYPTSSGISVYSREINVRKRAEEERERLVEELSQLSQREMRAARTAEALSKVDEILLSALTVDDVITRLVGDASVAAGADISVIISIRGGVHEITQVRGVRADLVGVTHDPARFPKLALAVAERRPVLVGDVAADARADKGVLQLGLRAFQLLPLMVEGELTHVLVLAYSEPQVFDDADRRSAERMAAAMSLALRNALTFEAEAESRRLAAQELRTTALLLEGATVLAGSSDLEEGLGRAIDTMREAIRGVRAIVYAFDETRDELRVLASGGGPAPPVGTRLHLSTMSVAAAQVLSARRSAVIDFDALPQAERGIGDRFGVHLLQAVPLVYQERLVGVLVMDDPAEPRREFSERELDIAKAFAAQAAAAVDDDRLLEAERRRVARLTTLAHLSSLVTSSLELEEVIAKGLEQVVTVLDVSATSLWMLDGDGQRLRLRGARGFGERFFADFTDGLALDASHDVAQAFRTGEPVVHEDARTSDVATPVRDAYARYGMQLGALIAMPLRSPTGLVGGLTLAWSEPRAFTDEAVAFDLLLADTFAIALDNARLYEAGRTRMLRIETLHELTGIAASTLDARQVAELAFGFLRERLKVAYVHAYTANAARDGLDFLAGAGGSPAFYEKVGRGIGLDEPLEVVPVFLTGAPIVRSDARGPDAAEAVRELYARCAMTLGSYLVLPLRSKAETLGVMVAAWREPQRFEEDDLRFYSSVANELAGALRNALLFAASAESARQVSEILSSMTDGFVSVDQDWRFILVNPAAEKLLHRSAAELIGRRLPDVFPDIDGLPHYYQAMDGRVPVAFETYSKRTGAWVEVHVYPSAQGLSILAADITERKAAEQERLRLLEASRTQARELAGRAALAEALTRVDRLVHSTLDVDEVMQRALDEGVRALSVDAGAVEMREGRDWIVRYQCGFAAADIGMRLTDAEAPNAVRVEQAGELLAITDMRADVSGDVGFVRRYGLRALLAIPLLARDETIGCLLLYGKQARAFDASEMEFGRTLGATVSLGLDNARLFAAAAEAQRQTERQLETTRLLIEAADALKSMSLADVLSKLTDIVPRVSGHARVTVSLWREELERLEVVASAGEAPVPSGLLVSPADLSPSALTAVTSEVTTLVDYDALEPGERGVGNVVTSHLALDVPLVSHGRLVGLLAVDDPGGRRDFSEREIRLVEGIAAQAATAIANAGLYELERESARFAKTLATVDGLVHSSLEFDEIVQVALREGAAALGAESCGLSLHEDREKRFRVAYVHDLPADRVGVVIPDEQDIHGVLAMQTGQTQAIHDTSADPRVVRKLMDAWSIRSVICAPLTVRGKAIGVLYYNYHSAAHHFGALEIDFLSRLAASVSTALGNARLYEAQRNVAVTLQEHFVHNLPAIEGIGLAEMSLPAAREELIGGDFRDVVRLPDGRVLALIGDVMGKGIAAAGLTETIRSAVRAAAISAPSPDTVLETVNRLLLLDDEHRQLATALLVIVDPRTGRGSMASAGHPPPVHISSSRCLLLELENGMPLGAMEQSFPVSDFALAPGDTLLLYTDGLTDARRDGELLGEDRLLGALASGSGQSPQPLVDGVRAAVTSFADDLRDDIQVLVVRRDHPSRRGPV